MPQWQEKLKLTCLATTFTYSAAPLSVKHSGAVTITCKIKALMLGRFNSPSIKVLGFSCKLCGVPAFCRKAKNPYFKYQQAGADMTLDIRQWTFMIMMNPQLDATQDQQNLSSLLNKLFRFKIFHRPFFRYLYKIKWLIQKWQMWKKSDWAVETKITQNLWLSHHSKAETWTNLWVDYLTFHNSFSITFCKLVFLFSSFFSSSSFPPSKIFKKIY